ncbi:Glycosyl transferases group 1 [Rhodoblastus acidophilus]|uniref:Glycosyl transferases group 1 n=1 Tax=Rhodoblastus acidophilus TaxID=1074 RepID=A0A212REE6_RHOAC|nr:glycosyltransferase [Rhodoblastus acidophilus]PPQ39731.1 glycosyltransferase family 4 protein [Rhodoblastus acidophilus]RAI16530.1 glycosyltransferase family 4 protein [Rhodoblastus acidophilus]SNB70709.1 Glycosyl transferases group 1 [Rhodoblastus acidophilus]
MHILLVHNAVIPVFAYGGTERVVFDLGKALTQLGHKVTFLVRPGSHCDFADVLPLDRKKPLKPQIPRNVDIVHVQTLPEFDADNDFDPPFIMTEHGNATTAPTHRFLNTVFISKDQAARHNSDQYVYNGLDWDAYGPVDFAHPRNAYHFLAKAAAPEKNVRGAIDIARAAGVRLEVLGGRRLNFKRGFRFTPWPSIGFHGMVGGAEKARLLNESRGLIYPVRWTEPFGLVVIESLYFGCPVFSTPYGSLRELVTEDVGIVSTSQAELVAAVKANAFDPRRCHDYARETFSALNMAKGYLEKYEIVANGGKLHARQPWLTDKSTDMLPFNP